MLPPVLVRRLVLAPLTIVATVVAFAGLPVLLLVVAAASTVLPGRWRPLRLLWMALLYLALESLSLVVLFAGDIPRDRNARIDWLFDWWKQLDWIAGRRSAALAEP